MASGEKVDTYRHWMGEFYDNLQDYVVCMAVYKYIMFKIVLCSSASLIKSMVVANDERLTECFRNVLWEFGTDYVFLSMYAIPSCI